MICALSAHQREHLPSTIFEKLPRSKARKSVSHSTLCWREMDSNYQSPVGSFADISQVCEMWYFAKISSTRFECLVGGVLRPPPVLHDVGPRDLPHMLVLDMGIARVVGPGYWHSRAEPEVRIHRPPADSLSLSRSRLRRSRTRLSARVWAAGLAVGSAETLGFFDIEPIGGNISVG